VETSSNGDWVAAGLRQARDELRLFLVTARDFSFEPESFAEQWASGRRQALNPLGFLATAFAIVGPAQAVALHLLHGHEDGGALLSNALGAVLPFVYYLALGTLQHFVLRLFGSRRRLSDSCAMALYAGGGPASAATLMSLAGSYLWFRLTGSPYINLHLAWHWPTAIVLVGTFSYVFITLAKALGRLHGMRSWQVVLASSFALLATSVFFAVARPPGIYGLHLAIGPSYVNGHWEWVCDVGTFLPLE
jgi:hypothetical protein